MNFCFVVPSQSQICGRAPLAVKPPGMSRQRPDWTFLKTKAPVGGSAETVHCWWATPGWQAARASWVPFATDCATRSTHFEASALKAIRQALPSCTRFNLCVTPSQLAYCWMPVPTAVDPLMTSRDCAPAAASGWIRYV